MAYCCICGNECTENGGELWLKGKSLPICENCCDDLDALETEERASTVEKLHEKMRKASCSYDIIEAVQEIIGENA